MCLVHSHFCATTTTIHLQSVFYLDHRLFSVSMNETTLGTIWMEKFSMYSFVTAYFT
jgi:hypothetical protein